MTAARTAELCANALDREAQVRSSPDTVLSPLPPFFVRAVILLLPVDTRLRCCEVSRAWRALLADACLWECINLSLSGQSRFSWPLLRAAAAKAGGQLRTLDISGQDNWEPIGKNERLRLLREVVTANATTLTELFANARHHWSSVRGVHALVFAAPALLLFEASLSVHQDLEIARAMTSLQMYEARALPASVVEAAAFINARQP